MTQKIDKPGSTKTAERQKRLGVLGLLLTYQGTKIKMMILA